MQDNTELEDLPEAVPLHKVAPFWRVLAILAGICMVGLLFVSIVFGIALMEMNNSYVAVAPAPPPAPVLMAPPVMATPIDDPDESDTVNAPYPLTADLARSNRTEPASENPVAPGEARLSARQHFLSKSIAFWTHRGSPPDAVIISPDGKNMAYVAEGDLMAGPIGSPQKLQAAEPSSALPQPFAVPQPGVRIQGGRRLRTVYSAMPGGPPAQEEVKLTGVPSWSGDSQFIDCADIGGRRHRFNLQGSVNFDDAVASAPPGGNAAFRGMWLVSLPSDPSKFVFVRSRPEAKIDAPGVPAQADPTEVLLGDLTNGSARVLVPANSAAWRYLSISPDGKQLALVSNQGLEGADTAKGRLFVMDLKGDEPRPLTSPASNIGPVAWTPDGKALVYARSQEPTVPSDIWDDEPSPGHKTMDLFQWDLVANRETRLSRGGGFFSPSVSHDGDLFFVAMTRAGNESSLSLRRMSLQAAREFAAAEPAMVQRDPSAWNAVLDRVLEECRVSIPADGADLGPERLAKVADTFERVYRERFKTEPPSTHQALERLRQELQSLNLPTEVRPKLVVVLGALEGEYLVRHQGARWHLTKGPLTESPQRRPGKESESVFAQVLNPFEMVSWWEHVAADNASDNLSQGRQLVLANDRKTGQANAAAPADPDLQRGIMLLKQDKGGEADQVLLDMMKQKRHEHNLYLVLHVGKLLYEHKRSAALHQLLEKRFELTSADARLYNLLGLADLETEPRQAIDAFKNALRCDLHFGPAYFNLAQAYRKIEDKEAARRCLLRYLRLRPDGDADLVADAERRLHELNSPSGN
jgi:hypothetical protein